MPRKEFDSLNYSMVNLFENDDHSDVEVFHEGTKLTRRNYGRLSQRVEAIRRDKELIVMMTRAWKTYAACPKVALPEASLGEMTLAQALLRRRSQVERFRGGPITVAQLSAILRYSYGPTEIRPVPDSPGEAARYRSAASAGGLYPLEIYPIVFDVEGCEPGLYHYSIVDHSLEVLRKGDMRAECLGRDLTPYKDFATTCSVMFAITGVFPRSISKYLFRGYRFIQYDVGVLLQNLYLTGTAQGVASCAIGGFYDNDVGEFLGVDNVDENVLMMFCVGQPYDPREGRGA